MRRKLAYVCFSLSSLFKGLGKLIITKEKTIVVDVLTLPGWFIMDECMIHQVSLWDKKLIGFEWHVHLMPDEWVETMIKLKGVSK